VPLNNNFILTQKNNLDLKTSIYSFGTNPSSLNHLQTMKLDFLHKAYKIVLILSMCTYSFAFKANISDTTSSAKTVPIPLPFLKKSLFDKEPTLEKTISDGQKQIKYTDDKNVVDCIFYEILSDKNKYEIGEQVKIKIKIVFYDNLNLSYKDEECQKIALKVVLPKGFSQTGGSYYDFISLTLDKNNKSKELEIIGQFYEINQEQCFILLKGPSKSNWETIFIKKGEKCLEILEKTASPKLHLNNQKQNVGSSTIKETVANSMAEACTSPTTTPANRCGEGVVTLTASGCSGDGATYTWYNHATAGTELGTSTDGTFTTSAINASATYSVTCTTNACTASDRSTISITITAPKPTITPNGPLTFCSGESVILSASTCNGSLLWSSGQTSNSITVFSSGTYSVVCTENSCTSQASSPVVVNVNPIPTAPTISSTSTLICYNSTLTLTSTGCTGTTIWSTGATGSTLSVNTAGAYTAKCEINNCISPNSNTLNLTVATIINPPTINIASKKYCNGQSTTTNLIASGCATYSWSTGQTTASITVTPTITTTYTVKCVGTNGCFSSQTLSTIEKTNLPVVNQPILNFNGQNILVNNFENPQNLPAVLSVPNCNGQVNWNRKLFTQSLNPSIATNTPQITVTENLHASYYITCYNACSSQQIVRYYWPSKGPMVITNNGPKNIGESITLTANFPVFSSQSLSVVYFRWTLPDGTVLAPVASTRTLTRTITNGSANGIYSVTAYGEMAGGTNLSPVTSTSNVVINNCSSNTIPTLNQSGNILLCNGQSLTASNCTGTIKWSTGATGATLPITASGTYSAQCVQSNGCISAKSSEAVITLNSSINPPTFTAGGPTTFCSGNSVNLTATGCASSVEWSNGSTTNPLNVVSAGNYTARCKDGNNCLSLPSNSISIVLNPEPITLSISNSTPLAICSGGNVTLQPSSGCEGVINWDWSNTEGGSGTITTSGSLEATNIIHNTTYKAKCTTVCGTSTNFSNLLTVTVNNPIITSATSNFPLNAGSTLNFNLVVSGTNTYSWTGPNTFTSTLQNPTIPNFQTALEGVYSVTVTSTAGCTATASVNVLVLDDCKCTTCGTISEVNYAEWPTPEANDRTISVNKNYVEERIFLTENASEFAQSIQYFDGLGRPIQTVSRNTGADGKDVISFMKYDAFGRETEKYMPYTDNHALTGALPSFDTHSLLQKAFYNGIDGKIADKDYAFAKTIFEDSPLNRVLQQGAPGLLWQPNTTNPNANTNHAVKMIYTTNTFGGTPSSIDEKLVNNIKRFDINTIVPEIEDQTVAVSSYDANQLMLNITIDENGNRSAEAKDKSGQVVAKRVQDKTDSFIETNYVYDDFGQLRFVFQPEAAASLTVGTLTPLATTSPIKELTFAYNYDERGRITQKKVPSAAKVEMVYDSRDRLVFTQDAWGRDNSRNRWLYTEYDELNRPLASGYYTQNTDRTTLQTVVNAGNALGGTKIALTTNTYDTYEGTDASLFSQGETYGQAQLTNVKGMMTKSVTRIVGIDETNPLWDKEISNVSFYDTKGRPIKTVSTNHTGGQDISVSKIDFTDRAITSTQVSNYKKTATETETRTIQTKNTYDKGGRMVTLCQKIDNDNWEQVSKNQYYPLGELKTKGLGCDNSTGSPLALQSVDYEYNIRGWLTDINKIADASMTANKDLFAMKLSYATAASYDGAEVSNTFFNGNIVKQEWNTLRSLSGAEVPSGIQTYIYKYDKLNRLMEGTYIGTLAEGINTTMYDPTRGYDKNGNIGYLKRTTGGGTTMMDELIYTYSANQLTKVVDDGDDTKGFKDKDNTTDYSYDQAGNLVTDANKDLSIAYNHLNLPESITRTNSGSNNGVIKHYYAGATKVRMETYDAAGTNLIKAYDYLPGMVYQETVTAGNSIKELDFVASSEGRALLTKKVLNLTADPTTGDKFRFEYSLKDHLGNLRVSCRCGEPKRDTQGIIIPEGTAGAGIEPLTVVQEQHYDAWGLTFGSGSLSGIEVKDRFKFLGREEQAETGWVDLMKRMYDPPTARFSSVDPSPDIAGQESLSTYQYGYNNPLRYPDPNGDCPACWEWMKSQWYNASVYFNKPASQAEKEMWSQRTGIPQSSIKTNTDVTAAILLEGVQNSNFHAPMRGVMNSRAKLQETATTTSEVNLQGRANDIQNSQPSSKARNLSTTAVAEITNTDGTTQIVVSSSRQRLTPAQRNALKAGEMEVKGKGHAEATIINHAENTGSKVNKIAASRPICQGCQDAIGTTSALILSPVKPVKIPFKMEQ
jgi:RHS repeat-associated protein